jgi:hypothetical protein
VAIIDDTSLKLNSYERCLDKPQKLLRKARIGVMQKDWITTGTAACSGIAVRWLVTQPVGSPLPFVQRVPVAGAGLESLLPFVRQLPIGRVWPNHRPGTRDLDHGLKPPQHTAPLDELERAPNRLRHCLPVDLPEHAAFPLVIQSFCITLIRSCSA